MVLRGILSFILLCMVSYEASGQLDPSSTLLLDSGSDAVDESGLDTGRYKVRKRTEEFSKPVNIEANNQNPKPPAVKKVEVKKVDVQPENNKPVEEDNPSEKVAASSDETEKMDRPTVLNFKVAPFYFYNDSSSTSLFRSYNTSAPGVKAQAEVWMNKSFGLFTGYSFTLGASIPGSLDGNRRTRIDHQWFSTGFMYREIFSKKKQMQFHLGYFETELQTPSDETFRVGLRSSGVYAGFKFKWAEENKSWYIASKISPFLAHKEIEADLAISSGDKDESHRLSLSFGRNFELSESSGFYWEISHELEKNSFKNSSSPVDPIRQVNIENVQVIQSSIFVEFGYYWGK